MLLITPHAIRPARSFPEETHQSCLLPHGFLSKREGIKDDGCQTAFFCLLSKQLHLYGASFSSLVASAALPCWVKTRGFGDQLMSWPETHSSYSEGKMGLLLGHSGSGAVTEKQLRNMLATTIMIKIIIASVSRQGFFSSSCLLSFHSSPWQTECLW